MIKLPKALSLVILVFLIGVQPTWGAPGAPGTASEHFVAAAGGETIKLGLKVTGVPAINTAELNVPVGAADAVADFAANELCLAINANTDPDVCPACPGVPNALIACGEFDITTPAGFGTMVVSPGTAAITALNCVSNSLTTGPDLLDRVLVRVNPNGVNGNVVFNVNHTQGGTNPRTFTVNTTGLSDLALHNAIRDGYNSLGLGLNACNAENPSWFPDRFTGNFVEVSYTASTRGTLDFFEVDGLNSQIVTTETSGLVTSVPTLSEWGMGLLVATILLTGLWMLRRQRRLARA